MADGSFGDKTEAPTPRRIADARQDGKVAKSQDVNTALMLAGALLVLSFWAPHLLRQLVAITQEFHGHAGRYDFTPATVYAHFLSGTKLLVITLLPLLLPLVALALFANLVQVGFLFSPKALAPKLDKLNPLSGLKRLVSWRGAVELVKSVFKILCVGLVGALTIRERFAELASLSGATPGALIQAVSETTLLLGFRVAVLLAVLAVADYVFQRWQHQRSLRMTKKEVLDERRMAEGDPHVMARIRGLMREASRRRMFADVPQADVVVTNPVHVAVALRYDAAQGDAPIVLAKGMRRIAEKIKAIAKENGVPIVENPPLARRLYRLADVGQAIPSALYRAVAEVLAFVYHLRGRAS